jgi:Tfp pilus assembly protein PilX
MTHEEAERELIEEGAIELFDEGPLKGTYTPNRLTDNLIDERIARREAERGAREAEERAREAESDNLVLRMTFAHITGKKP